MVHCTNKGSVLEMNVTVTVQCNIKVLFVRLPYGWVEHIKNYLHQKYRLICL